MGHEDSARGPGDRSDPKVGLADESACPFESGADVHVVLNRRNVRPRDGERPEDDLHLERVMFRSGAFCRSEFQLREHLERDPDFRRWMREKFFPHMICAATETGDEDVRIDEAGHLRSGIEGFHGGRKDALRGSKGIISDGAKGRHPIGGVGHGRNLARTGGKVAELLGGPVRKRLAAVRREGIKPQLQPVIKIQDESAHGW